MFTCNHLTILCSDIDRSHDFRAPDFMRFFTMQDPDGNVIHVGQYLRDPLAVGG